MRGIYLLESLEYVTISFKVHSAFHHLIHVSFFKSYVIREIDELYVHYTLDMEKQTGKWQEDVLLVC